MPHTGSFWACPFLNFSEWMIWWYPKFAYGGGWVSENNQYFIYLQKDIGVFWNRFCFQSTCRLFDLNFTKNIHGHNVGKTFLEPFFNLLTFCIFVNWCHCPVTFLISHNSQLNFFLKIHNTMGGVVVVVVVVVEGEEVSFKLISVSSVC